MSEVMVLGGETHHKRNLWGVGNRIFFAAYHRLGTQVFIA